MGLTLNANDARKADSISSVIRETGKYVGVITRAERLVSKNNVEGVGFSFKSDDGASANYLDVYTVKPNGEKLRGHSVVQAILCCLKLREVGDGEITFEKWDREQGRMVQDRAPGYPDLIGKRIGFVLQKELASHSITGQDTERMNIYAVFQPGTDLVSSEILDGKTKGERLDFILRTLKPFRDTRNRVQPPRSVEPPAGAHDFDDDIPF